MKKDEGKKDDKKKKEEEKKDPLEKIKEEDKYVKQSKTDPWRVEYYRHMDEEDWLKDTPKGYELDEDEFEYDPVLTEEKLAKFREEIEEDIVKEGGKMATEAEHKLNYDEKPYSRYYKPKGLV